jgi:hypothetical protein
MSGVPTTGTRLEPMSRERHFRARHLKRKILLFPQVRAIFPAPKPLKNKG